MTRTRVAWLAAAVALLSAAAYLLARRRRQTPTRIAGAVPAPAPVARAVVPPEAVLEDAVLDEPSIEEAAPVPSEPSEVVDVSERPLATWIRVAIIAAALVAFFAVSLIATKQV